MNPPSSFDAQLAFKQTKALCYPRRTGTRGERRAARYVHGQLEALGFVVKRERFSVSLFPPEIGSRILLVLCAVFLALGGWLTLSAPLQAALCWAGSLLLVNAPWRAVGFIASRWPPRVLSENVLATLPTVSCDAPARVVFMAHYDTKSQLLPTGVRVALVSTVAVISGLLALVGLARAVGLSTLHHPVLLWTVVGAAIVCLLALIGNITGNRSPGALDNGSAVGTLLELARSWRARADMPVEALFVATGAEEIELNGARDFLNRRQAWWLEKPTLLINLESVGAGAKVFLAGEPQSLKFAEETAAALAMPHARFAVVGAGMDHEPFAACGLASVSLLGDVIRKSLVLHSRRDDMKIVEHDALARAGLLASELAWRWAERHQAAGAGEGDEVVSVKAAWEARPTLPHGAR